MGMMRPPMMGMMPQMMGGKAPMPKAPMPLGKLWRQRLWKIIVDSATKPTWIPRPATLHILVEKKSMT